MAGLIEMLAPLWMFALGWLTVAATRYCTAGRRWFEWQLRQAQPYPHQDQRQSVAADR